MASSLGHAVLVGFCVRFLALSCAAFALAARSDDCVPVGTWIVPGTPAKRIGASDLLRTAAGRRVVLLGEHHDSAEHHRWQLHTIAGLHALHPEMVIALEMFPRRVQGALDQWVAGGSSEADFLVASDWRSVWSFDPQLYLPIFHFARANRVPMAAINVDQSLTRAVGKSGFDAIAEEKREGITPPAPATDAYIETLLEVYAQHQRLESAPGKPDRNDPGFRRFVETQLVWDRALAQGIVAALGRSPHALVAGVIGRGHLAHGHGVAHQLRALGVTDTMTLLPWDRDDDCTQLTAGLADAVFGVAAPAGAPAQRQRLGVALESAADGVVIREVEKGSVAEAAGIRGGDVVSEIAGLPARQPADVVDAVQRQAPGTWLPLKVRRQGETIELVAKFPPLAK